MDNSASLQRQTKNNSSPVKPSQLKSFNIYQVTCYINFLNPKSEEPELLVELIEDALEEAVD